MYWMYIIKPYLLNNHSSNNPIFKPSQGATEPGTCTTTPCGVLGSAGFQSGRPGPRRCQCRVSGECRKSSVPSLWWSMMIHDDPWWSMMIHVPSAHFWSDPQKSFRTRSWSFELLRLDKMGQPCTLSSFQVTTECNGKMQRTCGPFEIFLMLARQ